MGVGGGAEVTRTPVTSPQGTSRRGILFTLLLVWLAADATRAQQPPPVAAPVTRVLLVLSYEQGSVWTDAIVQGFREVVENSDVALDLWIEYLDVHRHADPGHLRHALQGLANVLAQTPFDVLVACDDAAVALVAEHQDTVFAGLPVVACGVNERAIVDRFPDGRVTAHVEVYDPAFMPRLAQRLRPGTDRFLVVTDNTRTGAMVHQLYRDFAGLWPDLRFEFLDGRTLALDDIVAAVRSAGPRDAVLISHFLQDREQRHYPRYAAVRRIAEAAGAPVYSTVLSTLGNGVMMGLENRGHRHGTWAGRRTLEWLADPQAAPRRIEEEASGRVVADVQVLAHWGVSRNLLPANAILVNAPTSFFRENRVLVLGASGFVLAQMLAIAVLAVNVRRRRRAEEALRARTRHLERTLAELERARLERVEIEERMRQGERLESMGRLAGGIAHDFNNLLTVILSYAELAAESAPGNTALAEQLEQIRLAGASAADLTRQILAFSRKQVLQPAVVEINALVRESHGLLSRLLGTQVEMALDLGADLPPVRIDRTQLQLVLINLAVNARDAMPEGGTLSVKTSTAEVDDTYIASHPTMTPGCYVVIAVSDTGVGMPREVLDHIFDPFFTTKPKGRGTGLGLASVYGTVKQSGGWIWAYSEVGRGTTFRIHLPALAASEVEPVEAQTT